MKAFITGIASISAQPTFGNEPFSLVRLDGNDHHVIEPDYAPWIDQRAIRRMSKFIRMGVASSLLALKEAGIQNPDAIVVGTGLGCVEDTVSFLKKLIENNEEALNPTPFIQSTHNTVASQIALLLQCLGYNQTYTQRGFSFECAVQDAMMLAQENPTHSILVGGVDERTNVSDDLFKKSGITVRNGEGASFFVFASSASNAWAQLVGLKMIYKPQQASQLINEINQLLESASISKNEIDLVLTGECGSAQYDSLQNEVMQTFAQSTSVMSFKNVCGEFSTASGFGLWLACMVLKKGFSSNEIVNKKLDGPVKTILLYNQYLNQHHSLILLKNVEG